MVYGPFFLPTQPFLWFLTFSILPWARFPALFLISEFFQTENIAKWIIPSLVYNKLILSPQKKRFSILLSPQIESKIPIPDSQFPIPTENTDPTTRRWMTDDARPLPSNQIWKRDFLQTMAAVSQPRNQSAAHNSLKTSVSARPAAADLASAKCLHFIFCCKIKYLRVFFMVRFKGKGYQ